LRDKHHRKIKGNEIGREMGVVLEAEIQQHRSVSLPVTDEATSVSLAVENLISFRRLKE
jgi:hypothetical protein